MKKSVKTILTYAAFGAVVDRVLRSETVTQNETLQGAAYAVPLILAGAGYYARKKHPAVAAAALTMAGAQLSQNWDRMFGDEEPEPEPEASGYDAGAVYEGGPVYDAGYPWPPYAALAPARPCPCDAGNIVRSSPDAGNILRNSPDAGAIYGGGAVPQNTDNLKQLLYRPVG